MNTSTSTQTNQTEVPAGYMQNAKGHLIPSDKVKDIDKLRDETVNKILAAAKKLQATMREQKADLFADLNDFIELSAAEYDTKLGGKKGNIGLNSYDGKYKVQLAISENIVFDERLQIAKTLIDECIHEWSEGSNDNIKALINDAFNVDKAGKINTNRVLGLRRLDITDKKWLKAMDAISDAVQVTDTKEYMRFYERDENGTYHQVSLDFSSL